MFELALLHTAAPLQLHMAIHVRVISPSALVPVAHMGCSINKNVIRDQFLNCIPPKYIFLMYGFEKRGDIENNCFTVPILHYARGQPRNKTTKLKFISIQKTTINPT